MENRPDGIMTAASGAKPLRLRLEPCFPLRFPGMDDLGLSDPVDEDRNPQRPLLRVGFGHVDSPAFGSVTRRTLRNAFARDRSISFWRLRRRGWSRAWDVKIPCRRRRTSASTRGQSRVDHVPASSGPFTAAGSPRRRLTCPLVPVSVSIVLLRGLTSPASAPCRAGREPVSGQGSGLANEGPGEGAGVLLPFGDRRWRLGSSCARGGVPPLLRGAYRPQDGRTLTGFSRCSPARCDRGGCLLYRGDGGALPGRQKIPGRHLPLSHGQSLSRL